jgi:hypothetical protein
MKYERTSALCLLSLLFVLAAAGILKVYSHPAFAAPRLEGIRPGDCMACHENEKVVPPSHISTKDMDLFGCRRCHSAPAMRLRGKMPLSHIHQLLGVSCNRCHGVTRPPKPSVSQDCFICHGDLEKLAARTSNLKVNPHHSPHYGKSLDCNFCHHEHSKSENYCARCHSLTLVVP